MRQQSISFVALLLAACAVVPRWPPAEQPARSDPSPAQATERRAKAPRPAYNLAGYPRAVREGYIDGCETAKSSVYAQKDQKRFAADDQYRMGWNDGFSICSRR